VNLAIVPITVSTPVEAQSLFAILRERRSIRRFKPDPVPADLLDQVLQAARLAPSAGNRQAYRLLVVRAPGRIAGLAAAVEERVAALRQQLPPEDRAAAGAYLDNFLHFSEAPVVIAFIHRGGLDLLAGAAGKAAAGASDRAERDALCSVSAAIMCLLLATHAVGLGACWMTGPLIAAGRLAEQLEVPAGWTLSALVPIGFPAETPAPPPRRPLARLVVRLD
jgi:nitroreductase